MNYDLALHLSRSVFATGKRLSGVVVFRLARPINIRSLTVSVSGKETPSGFSLTRGRLFFDREVLLSGMQRPCLTSERLSLFWNTFLGRESGRVLSAGEHIYPFSIPLPASLPPSYEGKAGRIAYTVTACVQFPLVGSVRTSKEVSVVFVPRLHKGRPVALSYPTEGGAIHAGEVSVSLELPRRAVEIGKSIAGKFTINNPKHAVIARTIVSLENCEWVRLASGGELQRSCVDSQDIRLANTEAESIEGEFSLTVPHGAVPSVEGTAISVIWLLKLYVDTSPPLELKTPITVYAPITRD